MEPGRCKVCPFADVCFKEWFSGQVPTPKTRVNMSLDKLAQLELMDDND